MSAVRQLIDTAVADRIVPGAVLAAGIGGATMLIHTAGNAQDDDSGRRPVSAGTIFDLASLTKVVATAPCMLLLAASGQLGLDDPAVRYLPSFTGPGKDQVTIRQLLTHTSGLPEHRAYYQYLTDAGQLRAAALAEPLVAAPGSGCRYSDIGFMVLGQLAEAVCGCDLADTAWQLVCQPLRMTATQFRPPASLAGRIASTEIVAGAARTGLVHDENAELAGGVAGHAGLFGTAADLGRYAAAWTCPAPELPDGWLPAGLRAEALRCQTAGLDGRRGLGWGLRGDRFDNMGDGWPRSGAGHTGFTGTSLSVDPVTGLWAVLLTNAVHFGRGRPIAPLRRQVHAAVAAALLGPPPAGPAQAVRPGARG
ncbi:MAG TPA: serine hydrolase domain-containing protein [Streptosporangiaceae bacterium]|nr:serine hydrolase domain-containing protein [Streptosporangiaceae bacterium]